MKPEDKLDTILMYLYEQYDKDNLKFEHSNTICHYVELKVNPTETYLILLKLNADGYIDMSDSNQWMFQINYNGILFCRCGGYKQQLKDLNRKRIKDDIYSVMVAVGTSLAGAYAIWEFLKEISS
jgi:hypothetical protein